MTTTSSPAMSAAGGQPAGEGRLPTIIIPAPLSEDPADAALALLAFCGTPSPRVHSPSDELVEGGAASRPRASVSEASVGRVKVATSSAAKASAAVLGISDDEPPPPPGQRAGPSKRRGSTEEVAPRKHWSGVIRGPAPGSAAGDEEADADRRLRMNHLRRCNEDMRILMLGWTSIEVREAGKVPHFVYEHPRLGRARSKKEIFRLHKGEKLDFNSVRTRCLVAGCSAGSARGERGQGGRGWGGNTRLATFDPSRSWPPAHNPHCSLLPPAPLPPPTQELATVVSQRVRELRQEIASLGGVPDCYKDTFREEHGLDKDKKRPASRASRASSPSLPRPPSSLAGEEDEDEALTGGVGATSTAEMPMAASDGARDGEPPVEEEGSQEILGKRGTRRAAALRAGCGRAKHLERSAPKKAPSVAAEIKQINYVRGPAPLNPPVPLSLPAVSSGDGDAIEEADEPPVERSASFMQAMVAAAAMSGEEEDGPAEPEMNMCTEEGLLTVPAEAGAVAPNATSDAPNGARPTVDQPSALLPPASRSPSSVSMSSDSLPSAAEALEAQGGQAAEAPADRPTSVDQFAIPAHYSSPSLVSPDAPQEDVAALRGTKRSLDVEAEEVQPGEVREEEEEESRRLPLRKATAQVTPMDVEDEAESTEWPGCEQHERSHPPPVPGSALSYASSSHGPPGKRACTEGSPAEDVADGPALVGSCASRSCDDDGAVDDPPSSSLPAEETQMVEGQLMEGQLMEGQQVGGKLVGLVGGATSSETSPQTCGKKVVKKWR